MLLLSCDVGYCWDNDAPR